MKYQIPYSLSHKTPVKVNGIIEASTQAAN